MPGIRDLLVHWPNSGRSLNERAKPVRLLNLYLVEKPLGMLPDAEPKRRYRRLTPMTCNFSEQLGVVMRLQKKRIAVVGDGNIEIGNKTATRNSGQPKPARPGICGAMSQQCGDLGNQSAPQKFVQLIGYRDPKGRTAPWVRPTPAKR
jgi:hypothetical protein